MSEDEERKERIAERKRLQEERDEEWRKSGCTCCGTQPLDCPFCGKPGKIFGENMVGCSAENVCDANIDFGHWCGEENGIPAVHHVIEQWNKRVSTAEVAKAHDQHLATKKKLDDLQSAHNTLKEEYAASQELGMFDSELHNCDPE